MDQGEHNDLVAILAEAQAIVEEGLGALSSSTMRDHILVHLCGDLVGEWLERRDKAAEARRLPLRPPPFQEFMEEATAVLGGARETAQRLTAEMMNLSPQQGRQRQWVWDTYQFFYQRALETKEADNGGPES